MPENLVLLHGFAGTRGTWDGVVELLGPERYTPLAIDLPGHGLAVDSRPAQRREPGPRLGSGSRPGRPTAITFDGCVEHVLAHSPQRFILCGYSLGGRLGLHVALAAAERVSRLVLVSSTAGIADDAERSARRTADDALAEDLEENPLVEFMDRWEARAVFAEDPPEVHATMRTEQQRNDPWALAAVLRGIGTGAMPPLWDRLTDLEMPVTVLVGERDVKFHAPARRMVELLPDADLAIVPGGHRLALENPRAVADAIARESPSV